MNTDMTKRPYVHQLLASEPGLSNFIYYRWVEDKVQKWRSNTAAAAAAAAAQQPQQ